MEKIIPFLVVIMAASLIVYAQAQSNQGDFCNEEIQCKKGLECVNKICTGQETVGTTPPSNGDAECPEGYIKEFGVCVKETGTSANGQTDIPVTGTSENKFFFIGSQPKFWKEMEGLENVEALGQENIIVWEGFPSFRFDYDTKNDVITIVDDSMLDTIAGKHASFFADQQFNYIVIRESTPYGIWEKEATKTLTEKCDTGNTVAYTRQLSEGFCSY